MQYMLSPIHYNKVCAAFQPLLRQNAQNFAPEIRLTFPVSYDRIVKHSKKGAIFYCRGMEQSVARRAHNPKVVGSSPTPATT